MNYVGSRFEGLSLGQGLPSIQMQDRWNTSLDGLETDVADVVAHLTSAIATIAGHVAKPSDKVVDLMFLELDEAGHCVQPSSPSMHSVASLDCVRAGYPRWVLLNVSLGSATLSFSTLALPNCLASSIG